MKKLFLTALFIFPIFFIIFFGCTPEMLNTLSGDDPLNKKIPGVISISPLNGSTIGVEQPIEVVFTKSMNVLKLKISGSMDLTDDGGVWSKTNKTNDTLTISPLKIWDTGVQTLSIDCSDDEGVGLSTKVDLIYKVLYLIDNFDDANDPNLWGGNYMIFTSGKPEEAVTVSYDAEFKKIGSEYGLKIDYNVPTNESFVGVNIQLASSGGYKDISKYEYFTFWVLGSNTDIPLKIEFHSSNYEQSDPPERSYAYLYINDYLDGGISDAWQEVNIPLKAFASLDSLEQISEILIVFEHDYAVYNNMNTAGSVYIDDLGFDDVGLDIVRIDHFGDRWGWTALGGNMGDINPNGGGTHDLTFDSTVYHDHSFSLKTEYNVTGGWSGLFMIFGGGSNEATEDGWKPQPCDLSDYRYLSFWVKAEDDDKNPQKIKIELAYDDNDNGSIDPITEKVEILIPEDSSTSSTDISPTWQKYIIDLNTISGLDKSVIGQMNIIYEPSRAVDLSGVLNFDEFQLSK